MPRSTRSSSFSHFPSTNSRLSATYHSLRSMFARRNRQRIHQLETSQLLVQQKLDTLTEEQNTLKEQLNKHLRDKIVMEGEKALLHHDVNTLKQQLSPLKHKRPRLRAIVTDEKACQTDDKLETVVEDVQTSPANSDESTNWFALMTTTTTTDGCK